MRAYATPYGVWSMTLLVWLPELWAYPSVYARSVFSTPPDQGLAGADTAAASDFHSESKTINSKCFGKLCLCSQHSFRL